MNENIKNRVVVLNEIITQLESIVKNGIYVGIKIIKLNFEDIELELKKEYSDILRDNKDKKLTKIFTEIICSLESIQDDISCVGIESIVIKKKYFSLKFLESKK